MSGMAAPFAKPAAGDVPKGSFLAMDPDTITLAEMRERDLEREDDYTPAYRVWLHRRDAA